MSEPHLLSDLLKVSNFLSNSLSRYRISSSLRMSKPPVLQSFCLSCSMLRIALKALEALDDLKDLKEGTNPVGVVLGAWRAAPQVSVFVLLY